MKHLFVAFAFVACTVPMTASAADVTMDDVVQVGRYSYVAPVATPEQTRPLGVVVSLKLPQQLDSVGMAIDFLLQRSGYRLEKDVNREALALLYELPIPAVHRDLGPITLDHALRTLTGPEWDMKVNHLTRKIAFFAHDYRNRPEPFPSSREDAPQINVDPVSAAETLAPVQVSHSH